jgi:flagellar hook-associated protein 3 FlgL
MAAMRISTSVIYDTNVSTLNRQQANQLQLQQQISTGRRVVKPSDDPVAAARALEVAQSVSQVNQYAENQGTADDSLTILESKIGAISELVQYVKERAIQAGNAALSPLDRSVIGTDVQAQFETLVGLGNSTDANGEYLFSGYKGDTQPFQPGSSGNIQYFGDQGQRTLEVSQGRLLPVSDNGEELLMRVPNGSGGYTDLFTVLKDFITDLNGPGTNYQTTIGQLNTALDNVLRMQTRVGSRQVEVEALRNINDDLKLQYAERTDRLTGLDYASAISDLQQQQTYLQASRTTFTRVSGLSLFDFLR